jgi:hypothetical protein
VADRVAELTRAIDEMATLTTTIASELYKVRETKAAALRWLVHGQDRLREQLEAVRRTPPYEAVFVDPEPLISIVIPTFDNTQLLLERSLPSVFGQTYERLDVIVVGDAVAPAVERAVAGVADPRLGFMNLPYRTPKPDASSSGSSAASLRAARARRSRPAHG